MSSSSYDAVIIGAGIGGLVCGCYLAKAGMKVLICEQHHKPGGYCTSFTRKGFTFDAAAHSFGGYRTDGISRRTFEDLEIEGRIAVKKYNPSDVIRTPDFTITFWSDLDRTINEIQTLFPDEQKSIRDFFYFLNSPPPSSFAETRSWSFEDLLNKYFSNKKLKATLSFPLFGNAGLPPSLLSSFLGARIFKEFLLDGGYYPKGGMQVLPDILATRFKELGGDLSLCTLVKKIKITDKRVVGVLSEERGFIPSRVVVSNCDARQTFLELTSRKQTDKDFRGKVRMMIPSLSMFVVYLGLHEFYKGLPDPGVNMWFLPHYDLDKLFESAKHGVSKNIVMVRVSPDKKTVLGFANTSFGYKKSWDNHKKALINSAIASIVDKYELRDLPKYIAYKNAATPHSLFRYTRNYKGAAYGWAGTPSQLGLYEFKKPSFVQGLYLTGHWTTEGIGIPGVLYSANDAAKLILRRERKAKGSC